MSDDSQKSNLPAQKLASRAATKAAPDPDDIHAAWLAGRDYGFSQGRMHASVELAREWLHALATAALEESQRIAEQRHGPGWAETVTRLPVRRDTSPRRPEDGGAA